MNTFTHTQLVDALVKTHVHYATKKQPSDDELLEVITQAIAEYAMGGTNPSPLSGITWDGECVFTATWEVYPREQAKVVLQALREAGALR